MSDHCTVQLHCGDTWHDVATVTLFGEEREGWRARTYTGYPVEWAIARMGARDAHALASGFPVGLEAFETPHWPVFLIDMLPQGYGRGELLRRIGLAETGAEEADWRLLRAGAGNPIGNLRIKEAAEWLGTREGAEKGFTDDEVAERSEDFSEYLAANGLFVAGSSGVQGEWPKILLTRADDGLLYLDHTLPDARAREHFIVKFGRGTNAALEDILRLEAPYMALAARLGLRVHAPLVLRRRALFIPRFDRVCQAGKVVRLGQESIATLTGIPGFGVLPSHEQVCAKLMRLCADPRADVLEYLRRDVANIALGNKDNHARNTAVQRDFGGGIRLSPLYDFAPMYLHPDGIARRIRWACGDAGRPDWNAVVTAVCEIAAGAGVEDFREALVDGLRAMAAPLREIADSDGMGLDAHVLDHLRPGLLEQAARLDALA